jgi:hypothetical protein
MKDQRKGGAQRIDAVIGWRHRQQSQLCDLGITINLEDLADQWLKFVDEHRARQDAGIDHSHCVTGKACKEKAVTVPIDSAPRFDAAVAESAGAWSVRAEQPADAAFLQELYAANAPMANFLPPAMLLQQHHMQEANFGAQYPQAMRRILLRGGQPVGRIIIDWSGSAQVHGVDIAVLPPTHYQDESGRGGGLILLRAWLAICDALGRPASLFVRADNRARRLYLHLGFADVAGQAPDAPMIEMVRAARHNTGIKAVS